MAGKNARSRIDAQERRKLDEKRTAYILAWEAYQKADMILLYASVRDEADTQGLAEQALKDGKAVYYPRSIREPQKGLEFHRVQCLSDLTAGAFGIPEPAADDETCLLSEGIDPEHILVFVPGTAFDRQMARIGYGAGFYDRFLANFKGRKVGLLYDVQLFDRIAVDAHDVPMNVLVTEKGFCGIDDSDIDLRTE